MKTDKCEKLVCNLYNKKKLFHINKNFKAENDCCAYIRKTPQILVQSKNMASALHRYKHGNQNKSQE